MAKQSPTSRTLQECKGLGWTAQVVETWAMTWPFTLALNLAVAFAASHALRRYFLVYEHEHAFERRPCV